MLNNLIKSKCNLVIILIIVVSFYKFTVSGVSISDIYIFISSLLIIVVTRKVYFSVFNVLLLVFITLLIVTSFDDGILSALKMFSPFFMITAYGVLLKNMSKENYYYIFKKVVVFLSSTQLIIVLIFYSGLMPGIFNVVLPGNIGRSSSGWKINVFDMVNSGVVRFNGFFVEPSWFSLFFCFFVFLFFYLSIKLNYKIKAYLHVCIFLSMFFTLSLSGFIYLFICYFLLFLNLKLKTKIFLLVFFLIFLIVLIFNLNINNDYIFMRITNILSGNDNSTNARFFKPFEYLYEIIAQYTIFGMGAGDLHSKIKEIANDDTVITFQIAYFNILLVYGLLFGFIYMCFLHMALLKNGNIVIQVPLVLSMLISSLILTPIYILFSMILFFFPHYKER